MATKYDWGDGNGKIHSISLQAHLNDLAAQGKSTVNQIPSYVGKSTTTGPLADQQLAGKSIVNQLPLIPGASGAPAAGGAAAAGTPATTPAAATITPDATFLAQAAQRAFARTTQLNQLGQESSDDKTNTATTINRLIADAVGDRTKIGEGAAKEGLFYSGQLSKRLGDYETGLTRAKDDASTALGQREAARQAAITAINQGAPLDEAVAMADAGTRQTARDMTAADLGALVPDVTTPSSTQVGAIQQLINPPKVTASAPQTAKYKTQTASGGVWHVYPDGHKVWVPKRR